MATYVSAAISNEFRVKDEDAFMKWAVSRQIEVQECEINSRRYFQIYPRNLADNHFYPSDSCGWDDCQLEEGGDYPSMDIIADELSKYLEDGSVAILSEIGTMKCDTLSAFAVAVNSKGEMEAANLDDVMEEKARRLGAKVTEVGS